MDKETALLAIRDLDFDFETGKVSEDDYTALRSQLVVQAAQVMGAEEAGDDGALEALIAARNQARDGDVSCPDCGKPSEKGSRFCSHCGTAFQAGCPACGETVKPDDLFCVHCGAKLNAPVEVSA